MGNPEKAIILTGMHRSGTSLTASMLKSMGVNMGVSMLGGNDGNPKGHFENYDFLNFHVKVLNVNEAHTDGWTTRKDLIITERLRNEAADIIARNKSQVWGWKEPRTVLFLDFWQKMLPDAFFLFVYREPWQVIDSLYRRGDWIFLNFPDKAALVWNDYNRKIISFHRRFPEKSAVVHIKDLIADPGLLVKNIPSPFADKLNEPDARLFEKDLFRSKIKNEETFAGMIALKNPEVIQTYRELLDISGSPHEEIPIQEVSIPSDLYMDWMRLRLAEKERPSLKEASASASRQISFGLPRNESPGV